MKQGVAKPERPKKSVIKSRAKNKNSTDDSKLQELVPGNLDLGEKQNTKHGSRNISVSEGIPQDVCQRILVIIFK